MKQPKGIMLLFMSLMISCFLNTLVSGDWLRWGNKENTLTTGTRTLAVDTLHAEVHTAKPTIFRKSKRSDNPKKVETRTVNKSAEPRGDLRHSSYRQLRDAHGVAEDTSSKTGVSLVFNERDPEAFELTNVLIATDLEGGIHALSRKTGEIYWSINNASAPAISVTEPAAPNNETLIVEPYGDGNIYYYNIFQGLQKLPISIKQLVNVSPLDLKTKIVIDGEGTTIEDEKIYTGSRQSAVYKINMETGQIVSAYGPGTGNKCFSDLESNGKDDHTTKPDYDGTFVIGKTTYQLSIHNKHGIVYNVSYGTWQQNSADASLASTYERFSDGVFVATFNERSLLAVHSDLRYAKWISPPFQSTINNIFDVFVDKSTNERILMPHPISSKSEGRSGEKVFLGLTSDDCWFAMSDVFYPSLVDSASIIGGDQMRNRKNISAFHDRNAIRDAMLGVHELSSLQFEQVFNDEPHSVPKSLPGSSRLLIDGPKRPLSESSGLIVEENPPKALDRYISKEELLALRLEAQEQIALKLLSNHQKSFAYRLANFVYRIVEGGLMLVFSFFVLGMLSRFKIIAPLHVLLERNGFTKSNEIKAGSIEIEESSRGQKNNGSGMEAASKHVKIVEPEEDGNKQHSESSSTDRKRRKRGSRGGKKPKKGLDNLLSKEDHRAQDYENESDLKHLTVSKKVLGYGSSGTVVFQGTFQQRPVAIKRMLIDFYDIGTQEIKLLTESDHHPNVVRYYCSESSGRFLYIALELCTSSLEDVVEGKGTSSLVSDARKKLNSVNVLFQIAQGVAHLHSMKIVHRDLKPQNILVAPTRKYMQHLDSSLAPMRILISDFGLCKRLEPDQSSFHTNQGNASGTSGWKAPELLDGYHRQDFENDECTSSEGGAISSESFIRDSSGPKRLTRAIDIFSMGCVFYYVLSKGDHPFGDRYSRDGGILKAEYCLDGINKSLRDRYAIIEATDLITQMISSQPDKRPTAARVLKHPLFWSHSKKLEFLLKVSDRFEIERRVPPSSLLLKLEEASERVIPNRDWTVKFDTVFMENLGKYRKYSGEKLMDLLRAFRNKYHHFMDLPPELAEVMGPIPDGFYLYFARRFPRLLIEIYFVVQKHLKDDQILSAYF
ncbi:LANO_0B05600g1_1 [Lachancea nothofagi CBS 11611]|uniref:non-specific serine/threonine protein kinase n=1 Tax=Lachancea nothofagi CBS 11611 TaxID=1266666 RepID=A0A1G4IZ52_9SACH|nr:LANO_0B05600g1_1 [Lachancea nothofagi CBS 11611]